MQDEYGRQLSDDGQWVWDGSAWRPTGVGLPSDPAQDPGTAAHDPTAAYGATAVYGSVPSTPYRGGPPPPPPWYKRPMVMIVIIGALLVLLAVLATILVLTLNGDDKSTPPTPSPTTAVPTAPPTTATPSPTPTPTPSTEAPTTAPPTTIAPTTPPPTTAAPTTVSPGLYECTQAGTQFGSVNFVGNSYTTSNGGNGTYRYDALTGDLTFTGADLGDFQGVYDPTGPSMVLTSASGVELRCAQ